MITTNLASQFSLLHLQRGRSAQWSQMRTTEKKRSLSNKAKELSLEESYKRLDDSDQKHRSTVTLDHQLKIGTHRCEEGW
ncbi:hypothetical protein HID58_042753 [Brassica napus]|uniref:Uncharacterized protein n=1 Tax=Brassica napus TaxID=3708 RepID=A0ABQ8BG92_BRANA|nr:hypothetical protein HID58_042753 [Brassica napus]